MNIGSASLMDQNVKAAQDYDQAAANKAGRSSSAAPDKDTAAAAASSALKQEQAPATDRAEFSRDTDITKMSAADRASLVESLKNDLAGQMNRFTNMMVQTFQKQGITAATANDDDFWRMIASGDYVVDAKTKADAQEAISEDGFWGVKQTSQRIFDFAQAVAGDDPDKMKEMQAAVEKGFKQAEKSWGGSLPDISGETHSAVTKLFDEYYEKYGASEE